MSARARRAVASLLGVESAYVQGLAHNCVVGLVPISPMSGVIVGHHLARSASPPVCLPHESAPAVARRHFEALKPNAAARRRVASPRPPPHPYAQAGQTCAPPRSWPCAICDSPHRRRARRRQSLLCLAIIWPTRLRNFTATVYAAAVASARRPRTYRTFTPQMWPHSARLTFCTSSRLRRPPASARRFAYMFSVPAAPLLGVVVTTLRSIPTLRRSRFHQLRPPPHCLSTASPPSAASAWPARHDPPRPPGHRPLS